MLRGAPLSAGAGKRRHHVSTGISLHPWASSWSLLACQKPSLGPGTRVLVGQEPPKLPPGWVVGEGDMPWSSTGCPS